MGDLGQSMREMLASWRGSRWNRRWQSVEEWRQFLVHGNRTSRTQVAMPAEIFIMPSGVEGLYTWTSKGLNTIDPVLPILWYWASILGILEVQIWVVVKIMVPL